MGTPRSTARERGGKTSEGTTNLLPFSLLTASASDYKSAMTRQQTEEMGGRGHPTDRLLPAPFPIPPPSPRLPFISVREDGGSGGRGWVASVRENVRPRTRGRWLGLRRRGKPRPCPCPPPPPFFFPVQWREGGKTRRGKGVSAAAAGGQIRKWPPFPFGGGSPNLFQDSLRCTSASVYVLCVQWLPRVSINVAEGFHLRGLASADPSPACGG